MVTACRVGLAGVYGRMSHLRRATRADLLQAVQSVRRCEGSYAAAARELNMGPATVRARYAQAERMGMVDAVAAADAGNPGRLQELLDGDRLRAVKESARQQVAEASRGAAGIASPEAVAPATAFIEPPPEMTRKWSERGDDAELDQIVEEPIKTLADLVRVCEVDVEEWEVAHWESSAWTVTMKLKSSGDDGKVVHRPVTRQNYRVRAKFTRATVRKALRGVVADMIEDARRQMRKLSAPRPRTERTGRRAKAAGGGCLVVNVYDVHVGKRAWSAETGKSYSLDEAEAMYVEVVESLLEKSAALDVDTIVFPFGNDHTHVDGSRRGTTAGTPQDMDGSWRQMVRASNRLAMWAVEMLSARARVIVPVVPGNHDADTVFHQGELLAARFDGNNRVEVLNEPAPRQYVKFGRNLLGFSHTGRNAAALKDLMAEEAKSLWAGCDWREFHTGHLHHRKVTQFSPLEEVMGVMVRICPALCPPDHWHAMEGYVGSKQGGEAFFYCREGGLHSQYHANISSLPTARGSIRDVA